MEAFKNLQGFIRHQRRKSDQFYSKEPPSSTSTSRSGASSISKIKQAIIMKHFPKSGNSSINLDLSKMHQVPLPSSKNNSARNLEHRRVNNINLQKSKERLAENKIKLDSAPDMPCLASSRFVERLVLAEQKLNKFYR